MSDTERPEPAEGAESPESEYAAHYDERYPGQAKPTETYDREGKKRALLMTPKLTAVGSLLVFFTVVSFIVVLPTTTYDPPPDPNWLPLPDRAVEGRAIYLSNGCVYCHSGFSRPQDVFEGRYYLYPRASRPGDYHGEQQSPNILGSERTGPDLSQEGGMHPSDWHHAHYENPRFTMPLSIMPKFSWWDEDALGDMIAFNQSQGGKEGILRFAAVLVGDRLMSINKGLLSPNIAFPALVSELEERGDERYKPLGKPKDISPWGLPWSLIWMVNSFDRGYWLTDNPIPLTQANLMKGKQVYLNRCAGCHGQNGDGSGPAAKFLVPKPFDFTKDKKMDKPLASEGMMYHRILTAGPGTAMENFGTRLSVEDMWRTVLFLRTIPNGGLNEPVPDVGMYDDWKPSAAFLRYIEDHPISEMQAGFEQDAEEDPFFAAARWVAPGLTISPTPDPGLPDYVLVGGQLPITLVELSELIEDVYFDYVERAYEQAVARGDADLPPREFIFSTEGVVFHQPS